MYNDQLFADGVHSVLLAEWELLCKTPLVIRNGQQIAYSDTTPNKTRLGRLNLSWQTTLDEEHAVAALHYGYEIRDGRVHSYHFVPASSVRGALRSWSIRHLVHPTLYGALTSPVKEDEISVALHRSSVRQGLAQRDTGCELIASLFGLAADESEESAPSNAGRLSIETQKFAGVRLRKVAVSDAEMEAPSEPDNVQRQMPVRNPLDRMTHASCKGGLHRFLEVCRGERFVVQLRIINPLDCDLGLLGQWVCELNDGMLRIGALASIGRGRMEVWQQKYELWRRANSPKQQGHALLGDETNGDRPNEILSGLWKCQVISPEKLLEFTDYLKEFTGGSIDVSLS
jgi:CRISPR/Cas system CSM-associated protein Csm3 (group 7 of RAMP superfamily)